MAYVRPISSNVLVERLSYSSIITGMIPALAFGALLRMSKPLMGITYLTPGSSPSFRAKSSICFMPRLEDAPSGRL